MPINVGFRYVVPRLWEQCNAIALAIELQVLSSSYTVSMTKLNVIATPTTVNGVVSRDEIAEGFSE
ncbi:hypothetical protein F7734_55975 [Scytonema sp. UIC 10036]|uniref:hypothetical protein n=1 Tax=Scytonema sp. UIC 10036 TaxID=2304196 RepID=UPI0012DA1B74|nr:hypothetical protein [Scytonema sp. UIC 10036]MUH01075.1 hypothetical protein [Scytonema sp. UIC 10036]